MFVSSAACLISWAWTGEYRRWPMAALFVAAYAASLAVPHNVHDPHWWRSTWPWITGVLLPLRVCMLVESAWKMLGALAEKWLVIAGGFCAAAAIILILLPWRPLAVDYHSFVAVRQYAQIAMAVFMGLVVMYAFMRPIRTDRAHAVILFVVLIDYAVASSFDQHSGLAGGFIVITATAWIIARTVANVILAICFVGWAALSY